MLFMLNTQVDVNSGSRNIKPHGADGREESYWAVEVIGQEGPGSHHGHYEVNPLVRFEERLELIISQRLHRNVLQ